MPMYDVKCKKCGHIEKDVLIARTDKQPVCSKCGKETFKYWGGGSDVAIEFKGTGFYKTDYPK